MYGKQSFPGAFHKMKMGGISSFTPDLSNQGSQEHAGYSHPYSGIQTHQTSPEARFQYVSDRREPSRYSSGRQGHRQHMPNPVAELQNIPHRQVIPESPFQRVLS